MKTAWFPSHEACEVVEVEFLTLSGESHRRKLLVDSGFTGQSNMILGADETGLIWAMMDPAQASGALHGAQDRAWVTCRISEIGFQKAAIAILTDLGPLSLPDGIAGMVGLSFLRQFERWGAEQSPDGWRFCLAFE